MSSKRKIVLLCFVLIIVAASSALILFLSPLGNDVVWYEQINEDEDVTSIGSIVFQIVPGSATRQSADVRLVNNTQYSVGFGAGWFLEEYRQGQWVRVRLLADGEDRLNSISALVPGSYIEHSVSFGRSFGRSGLSLGTFRIARTIHPDINNIREISEISTKFIVGRN